MYQTEFWELQELISSDKSISVSNLKNFKARTLLYGYNSYRDTYHVYLKDSYICVTLYNSKKVLTREKKIVWDNASDLVPDKRLYPEACDFEFCVLLRDRGIFLPFTKYDNTRPTQDFYGQL